MPKIKITFHKEDPLFKIKLYTILNQTENDKEMFASVYRDPDFINKMLVETDNDVTRWINPLLTTASWIRIIYLLIKLRRLCSGRGYVKNSNNHHGESVGHFAADPKTKTCGSNSA